MSDPYTPRPSDYEIRLRGHLDERWEDSFPGLELTHHVDPRDGAVTVLRGAVADESELHGLLARIRDLGISLLAVRRESGGDEAGDPTAERRSPTPEPRRRRTVRESLRETKEDR